MKMKQCFKILFLLAVICLLLTVSAFAVTGTVTASGDCGVDGDNLTWVLYSDGELVISGEGEMVDGQSSWFSFRNQIKKVTICNSVTSVGKQAFFSTDITSLIIPDSVTNIGERAFWSCSDLSNVKIGSGVESIGEHAFDGCSNMAAFEVSTDNAFYMATDGVLYNRDQTALIKYPAKKFNSHITLPDSVEVIEADAFEDCDNLIYVEMGENLKTIKDFAFSNCENMTGVDIPEGTIDIGEFAFSYNKNLRRVRIPVSVTRIGRYAFNGCSDLRYVYYGGTYSDWFSINIAEYNEPLEDVAWRHYHTEEVLNGVDADCTQEGMTEGSWCTGCKEIFVKQEAIPALGHTEGEPVTEGTDTVTYCTVCGEELSRVTNEPEIKIEAADIMARMVLKNELNMQFGVPVSAMEDWSGVYAVITKEYADREAKTVTVNMEDCTVVSGMYAIEFTGVAAKEMCDTVTLNLYDADGNVISEQKVDSVMDYALRTLRKSGTKVASKTQLVDMLNYGAAAQVEFEYSTDALANADLTEEEQALATQTVATENKLVKGTNYKGSRLMLKNRIELQIGFVNIDSTCRAVYTYTNHYGDAKTVEVEGKDFISVSGLLGVSISEPVVADCRNVITVTVYDANGEVVGYAQDSVESYVNRMSEGGDLFEAIMKFSDSSYAALH